MLGKFERSIEYRMLKLDDQKIAANKCINPWQVGKQNEMIGLFAELQGRWPSRTGGGTQNLASIASSIFGYIRATLTIAAAKT
jgi:hypothetical protein